MNSFLISTRSSAAPPTASAMASSACPSPASVGSTASGSSSASASSTTCLSGAGWGTGGCCRWGGGKITDHASRIAAERTNARRSLFSIYSASPLWISFHLATAHISSADAFRDEGSARTPIPVPSTTPSHTLPGRSLPGRSRHASSLGRGAGTARAIFSCCATERPNLPHAAMP